MKNQAHLILLLLLAMVLSARAQTFDEDERWHEGYLITTDGDTLHGELSYNMVTNMVKIRQDNRMRVFTSFQTFHYKLYDEVDRRWRKFFSIPFSLKNDHTAPVLFELLSEGKLSLLARERWKDTHKNDEMHRSRYLKKDYFFIDREGEIAYSQCRRGQLLDLMADHEEDLRQFMRENYLDLTQERSLQSITTFYNKLVFQAELRVEKEAAVPQTSPPTDLILGATNTGPQIWTKTDL